MLVMNKDGGLHWQSVKTFPISLPLAAAFGDMNHAWVTFRRAGLAEGVLEKNWKCLRALFFC